MTIETKYSPGDTVYLMKDNQIQTSIVFSVSGIFRQNDSEYFYQIEQGDHLFKESELFESPNDIISSLTADFPEIQSSVMAGKLIN